jgi:S1-C subfamily serine protease
MPAHAEFVNRLELAAQVPDRERVGVAVRDLLEHLRVTGEQFAVDDAKRLLGLLRRHRQFDAMQILADGAIRLGCDAPIVYRQYAQALIDDRLLVAARDMLDNLVAHARGDPVEYAEARGLMGRAGKQIYVETRGRQRDVARTALLGAIEQYRTVYEEDRSTYIWHGVNFLALLCRAARDGIAVPNAPDRHALANAIITEVEQCQAAGKVQPWDFATAAEACLALNDFSKAEAWTRQYVAAAKDDAFALAGTLRQFEEIWEIDPSEPTRGGLVAVLRAALLQSPGGGLVLSPAAVAQTGQASEYTFQRILGADGTKAYSWLQRGIQRARSVALIRRGADAGVGTGFLVRGGDLHEPLGDELLLLTNAHVVSAVPEDQGLPPEEAVAVFTILTAETGENIEHKLKLVWSSPREKLDATLLQLDPPMKGVEPCPIARRLPILEPDTERPQRVYVIGHPRGAELSFSLQDNEFIAHGGPTAKTPKPGERYLLHYRAPTEKGNSGSPVFNQSSWEVVGLHHAGGEAIRRLKGEPGTYAANEGIWVQAIATAVKRSLD